ncbi:MAG: hypothetical protein Q8R24_10165 [Legionellaceae bacterium]|nr:hypothetical protein [Legionellaceae bacterium]
MFSSLGESMFIMPICYHPTTVLSVDDDEAFSQMLAIHVEKQLSLLCFSNPEEAIEYTKNKHHYLPFTARCLTDEDDGVKFNFLSIRNEIYNPDRFKEIVITVTDYDMPHTSGVELIKTMQFAPEISKYSHIILTGKISDEFKEKVEKLHMQDGYISKDDPNYILKLLDMVENLSEKIFQWNSYIPARILSRNIKERTAFLFDGNFSQNFNMHIQENNICEFYLFDKQGSYIFLDPDANLSWLFVRNECGIENSIDLATKYGAPQRIIDSLKSKKVILSLYEKEDFDQRKIIDWDQYLLPATIFETNENYLGFFSNLMPQSSNEETSKPKYYYAFSKQFPEHGIETNKIVSYRTFLREQD